MEFNDTVETLLPRLRRYALRLTRNVQDADDLLQDTVLLALRKKHLFRDGTDLQAWMFTIMHNKNVTNVKRAVRRSTIELDEGAHVYCDVENTILLKEVVAEIDRLPPPARRVVTRVAFGASYAQVGQLENIPIGTVRSRISRAREELRWYLK